MRIIASIIIFLMLVLFTGCSTTSVITTYDTDGKIIKIEKVEKGAIDKLMDSVKDKSLIIWKSGWAAYISASPATTQDPTPTLKIFAGKVDEGYISVHKDDDKINWDGLAKVISATSKTLNVSAIGIEEKQ